MYKKKQFELVKRDITYVPAELHIMSKQGLPIM